MHPPRITIRRLMIAVAMAGIVLGSIVELPRLKRRWDYCQEQALIHGQLEDFHRKDERAEAGRLARTEAVLRKWEALGSEPRDLAWIVEASGDPEQASWFFKNRSRIGLLYGFDPRTEHLDPSEEAAVSPTVAASFIRWGWVDHWQESLRGRGQGARVEAVVKERFRRAAWRPWLPIPADPPL